MLQWGVYRYRRKQKGEEKNKKQNQHSTLKESEKEIATCLLAPIWSLFEPERFQNLILRFYFPGSAITPAG